MRMIHGVILLGALAAGCATANTSDGEGSTTTTTTTMPADPCSPAPSPDITVPVKFDDQCKMILPQTPAYVCPNTSSITWVFQNYCAWGKEVNVQIGPRKGAIPGNTGDPLNAPATHPPEPVVVDPPSANTPYGTAPIFANVKKKGVEDDCYTYTIGGTHPADPEIEVRRGQLGSRKLLCPIATTPHR